jgi:hypothetical protein
MRIEPVRAQLFSGVEATTPNDVASLFTRAATYQRQSSTFRLGNKVATGESTRVNRNLERLTLSRQILQERRDKKEQYGRNTSNLVKIHVHMYKWPFNGLQTQKSRMAKVSPAFVI